MAMSKEDALKRMIELIHESKKGDTEIAHSDADGILCELLIQHGYEEVVSAYYRIKKWYA